MELFITRPQYCVLTVSACALLLTSTHSLADTHAAALARVEILEDGRQVVRGQWRPLVNHESLGVRIAALKGIARIKDRRLLGLVESQLTHQDAGVRGAAAFAYSQLPKVSAQTLLKLLDKEMETRVKVRLLHGLRFIAGPDDIGPILPYLKSPTSEVRAQALFTIGDALRRHRGRINGLSPSIFAPMWTDKVSKVRFAMAYLFSHYQALSESHALYWAKTCMRDEDAALRHLCTRALSRYGHSGHQLRIKALNDQDWRVRIAAVNDPPQPGDEGILKAARQSLASRLETPPSGADIHAWNHMISAILAGSTTAEIAADFEAIFKAAQTWSLAGGPDQVGLSSIACGAATVLDRIQKTSLRLRRCGAQNYPQRLRDEWRVKSLVRRGTTPDYTRLIAAFPQLSSLGQIRALDALKFQPLTAKTRVLVVNALAAKVSSVVGAAADVCGIHRLDEAAQPLMDAYRRHYQAGHYAVVQSIFDALGMIGSESAQPILERHSNDAQPGVRQAARRGASLIDKAIKARLGRGGIQAAFVPGKRGLLPPPAEAMAAERPDLNLIKKSMYQRVTVRTNRGPFEIQLLSDNARETVKNFVRLAKKGFYRGLNFHAVNPGFFVQGGDPDGTGWGGPGFSIPCETGWQPFIRGSVGMALSGRDTGGSQFFITHRIAPELDGQYTRFGQVISGLDIVESLGVGDQILDVELHK